MFSQIKGSFFIQYDLLINLYKGIKKQLTFAIKEQLDALAAAQQEDNIALENKIQWIILALRKELAIILTVIFNRERIKDLEEAQIEQYNKEMLEAWQRIQNHINQLRESCPEIFNKILEFTPKIIIDRVVHINDLGLATLSSFDIVEQKYTTSYFEEQFEEMKRETPEAAPLLDETLATLHYLEQGRMELKSSVVRNIELTATDSKLLEIANATQENFDTCSQELRDFIMQIQQSGTLPDIDVNDEFTEEQLVQTARAALAVDPIILDDRQELKEFVSQYKPTDTRASELANVFDLNERLLQQIQEINQRGCELKAKLDEASSRGAPDEISSIHQTIKNLKEEQQDLKQQLNKVNQNLEDLSIGTTNVLEEQPKGLDEMLDKVWAPDEQTPSPSDPTMVITPTKDNTPTQELEALRQAPEDDDPKPPSAKDSTPTQELETLRQTPEDDDTEPPSASPTVSPT